jgi:hypothetical protein
MKKEDWCDFGLCYCVHANDGHCPTEDRHGEDCELEEANRAGRDDCQCPECQARRGDAEEDPEEEEVEDDEQEEPEEMRSNE